jgi:hypothetical protein
MTSPKQIEANRRNAAKSTGPTTAEGKQRSRCNAVRHGLTAETVIGALENAEDYRAFEAAVTADYDAQSAVEQELVLRLASLLWRLRRALAIETGLLEIEATELMHVSERGSESRQLAYAIFGQLGSADRKRASLPAIQGGDLKMASHCDGTRVDPRGTPGADLAHRFLQLIHLPSLPLDRLSRYQIALWRQVAQTLAVLQDLDRRKPQEAKTVGYAARGRSEGQTN